MLICLTGRGSSHVTASLEAAITESEARQRGRDVSLSHSPECSEYRLRIWHLNELPISFYKVLFLWEKRESVTHSLEIIWELTYFVFVSLTQGRLNYTHVLLSTKFYEREIKRKSSSTDLIFLWCTGWLTILFETTIWACNTVKDRN